VSLEVTIELMLKDSICPVKGYAMAKSDMENAVHVRHNADFEMHELTGNKNCKEKANTLQ
jgi:hypothetical protein